MIEGRLTRWHTPFTDTTFPAVSLIPDPERFGVVHLVVAPSGIDKYPKYLVQFDSVVAFRVVDESFPSDAEYESDQTTKGLCAHECMESAWVQQFWPSAGIIEARFSKPLRHFVVFGGDVNAEVLTTAEPEITEIDAPRALWHHAV